MRWQQLSHIFKAPLLILLLFPPQLLTSSTDILNPSMSSNVRNHFSQIPVDVDYFDFSPRIVAPRMVTPFQKVSNLLCPDPSEEHFLWQLQPYRKVSIPSIIRRESQNYSSISGRMDAMLTSKEMTLISLCIIIRALGDQVLVNEKKYIERNLFLSRSQEWA